MKKIKLLIFTLFAINSGVIAQTMVQDINLGSDNSNPAWFTTLGTDIYFHANDGINGIELWKYDGTTTTLIVSIQVVGILFLCI